MVLRINNIIIIFHSETPHALQFCSIVFNNEFSSRLSVGSIMRLRAAAMKALSQDSKDKSTPIFQLARRFLYLSSYERDGTERKNSQSDKFPRQIEVDNQGISTSYQQNETRGK